MAIAWQRSFGLGNSTIGSRDVSDLEKSVSGDTVNNVLDKDSTGISSNSATALNDSIFLTVAFASPLLNSKKKKVKFFVAQMNNKI
jgi:hypothetical protein